MPQGPAQSPYQARLATHFQAPARPAPLELDDFFIGRLLQGLIGGATLPYDVVRGDVQAQQIFEHDPEVMERISGLGDLTPIGALGGLGRGVGRGVLRAGEEAIPEGEFPWDFFPDPQQVVDVPPQDASSWLEEAIKNLHLQAKKDYNPEEEIFIPYEPVSGPAPAHVPLPNVESEFPSLEDFLKSDEYKDYVSNIKITHEEPLSEESIFPIEGMSPEELFDEIPGHPNATAAQLADYQGDVEILGKTVADQLWATFPPDNMGGKPALTSNFITEAFKQVPFEPELTPAELNEYAKTLGYNVADASWGPKPNAAPSVPTPEHVWDEWTGIPGLEDDFDWMPEEGAGIEQLLESLMPLQEKLPDQTIEFNDLIKNLQFLQEQAKNNANPVTLPTMPTPAVLPTADGAFETALRNEPWALSLAERMQPFLEGRSPFVRIVRDNPEGSLDMEAKQLYEALQGYPTPDPELGFDPRTFYHGSPNIFTEFRSLNGPQREAAVFFAPHPLISTRYGHNIYPARLRMRNAAGVDMEGNYYPKGPKGLELRSFMQAARNRGNDALVARNMRDLGGLQDQFMVFDPVNIRSLNAKFDPKKLDLPHLLAGLAGGGALLNLPQLLQQLEDDGTL